MQEVTRKEQLVKSSEASQIYTKISDHRFMMNMKELEYIPAETVALIVDVVRDLGGTTYYEVLYYGGSSWVLGNTRVWQEILIA